MKNSKIGLRHVLSGPKLCLESKFNDPGTFGCFGEHEQTHTPSRYNTEMSHFQNGRCHHLWYWPICQMWSLASYISDNDGVWGTLNTHVLQILLCRFERRAQYNHNIFFSEINIKKYIWHQFFFLLKKFTHIIGKIHTGYLWSQIFDIGVIMISYVKTNDAITIKYKYAKFSKWPLPPSWIPTYLP